MKLIYEETRTAPDFLTKALIDELTRGARLIEQIEDSVYCRKANGTGSIGGHFRHNLDFADSFLNGIQSGKIDYSRRERDVRTEANRFYAIERFALTIVRFYGLETDFLKRKIWVRSEIAAESGFYKVQSPKFT